MEAGEVQLLDEADQHGHVERVLEVGQVLPDPLLTQALPAQQELGRGQGAVVEEALLEQVLHAQLGVLVKEVEADAVLTSPEHIVLHQRGFGLVQHLWKKTFKSYQIVEI